MPTGKGRKGRFYQNRTLCRRVLAKTLGLHIVVLYLCRAFKSKSAGKNTVESLRRISQPFTAPETLMTDGGSHFDCNEVRDYCTSIGTKLHVVAAYSPWLNGLLERSNGILLNTLKRLCAPNLGEDNYERMAKKDIPSNWPDHLDAAIKNLSDRILPNL